MDVENKIVKFSGNYTLMDIDSEIFFLPALKRDMVESRIRCISNSSGKAAIRAINGKNSVKNICKIMETMFDASFEEISMGVVEFFNQLVAMGVLEYE